MKFLYTTCYTQFQVSDEDEIFLAGFSWKLSNGYVRGSGGRYNDQYLHLIIAERAGLDCTNLIDHRDRSPLNNQRDNLRSATHSQNRANSKSHSKSGFKGVSRLKGKWVAQITVNRKLKYLGLFDTPEEAHKAYCEAANEHFGEFARHE